LHHSNLHLRPTPNTQYKKSTCNIPTIQSFIRYFSVDITVDVIFCYVCFSCFWSSSAKALLFRSFSQVSSMGELTYKGGSAEQHH